MTDPRRRIPRTDECIHSPGRSGGKLALAALEATLVTGSSPVAATIHADPGRLRNRPS